MRIPFAKVVGTGNDFILVDARARRFPGVAWPALARAACNRHTSIGADGVLVLEPARGANARMRIFNADGSEAKMCGNGARCVARYLRDKRQQTRGRRPEAENGHVTLETRAGRLAASVRGRRVALGMTAPTGLQLRRVVRVGAQRLIGGSVNTGVPHLVIPVRDLAQVNVDELGRALRRHRAFAPAGTNVNFVQWRRDGALGVRTYERGVEGETLACGTGMVAAAIVASLWRGAAPGRRRIVVRPRSGDRLAVSFAVARGSRGVSVRDVVLDGATTRVFEGTLDWRGRGAS